MTLPEITVEQVMTVLGAIGTIGSFLASVLPKHLLITQVLARLFADARNIRGGTTVLPGLPMPPGPAVFAEPDELTPAESPVAKLKSDPPPPDTWR